MITVCLLMASTASRAILEADVNAGWGIAELVEISDSGDAENPCVAVDDSGNATAIWIQSDGSYPSVWSSRYVVGTGWGVPTLIETNPYYAQYPKVAIDASGNAIAVWHQQYDFSNSIWANRYVVGIGWGTAELIETNESDDAECPQVVVDDSGNAFVIWHQWASETQISIWYNRYTVGTGWGTAEPLETEGSEVAASPQIAIDSSGAVTAVWSQYDGTRTNIWSNRYVADTGWGEAQLLETGEWSAYDPQVAVDGSGNGIAVWSQHDGIRVNLWTNRYVVGTGWGIAELLETDNAGNAANLKVAVDGSGNAIAVWQQFDGLLDSIYSNRYVFGTGWGTAELLETGDAGDAAYPQVAIDGSGNAMTVWQQCSGLLVNIYSNRYVVGTGWGDAQLIETDNGGDAENPQVAIDGSGNATAVWQQHDGTRYNLWANRYVVPDTTPPLLSIDSPSDGHTTEASVVMVSGTTEPGVDLVVNGMMVAVEPDGSFSCTIALIVGENTIRATATDASDNSATVSVNVTYVNPIHELEEELADVRDELNATQDDLDAAEEELDSTNNDLSNVKSQNTLLMAVLAGFAILSIVMTVMFLSLRKKMAELGGKTDEAAPPPPPES